MDLDYFHLCASNRVFTCSNLLLRKPSSWRSNTLLYLHFLTLHSTRLSILDCVAHSQDCLVCGRNAAITKVEPPSAKYFGLWKLSVNNANRLVQKYEWLTTAAGESKDRALVMLGPLMHWFIIVKFNRSCSVSGILSLPSNPIAIYIVFHLYAMIPGNWWQALSGGWMLINHLSV